MSIENLETGANFETIFNKINELVDEWNGFIEGIEDLDDEVEEIDINEAKDIIGEGGTVKSVETGRFFTIIGDNLVSKDEDEEDWDKEEDVMSWEEINGKFVEIEDSCPST